METLKKLAEIAYEAQLKKYDSWEKDSLLIPWKQIFDKLNYKSESIPLETYRAIIITDIFEYLKHIAKEEHKPGLNKQKQIRVFVDSFFDELLKGIYNNNIIKILQDEKVLTSAYLCYMREQNSNLYG